MKIKNKVISIAALLFMFCFQFLQAQEVNYKIHAMFMYHFTKYIDWPENKKSGDFVIGVYGNSDIIKELEATAISKKAGGQQIVIKKLNSASEASQCHIIFISSSHSGEMDAIQQSIGSKPVLMVSEKAGLAKKGSGINFIIADDKLRFEINKSNIEGKTLKVSGDLLKLGIIVS
jgi:hypothetical protein